MFSRLHGWWKGFAGLLIRLALWADGRTNRFVRVTGVLLIGLGFLACPRVLGPLLSPDGRISMPRNVAAICIFELICAALGCLLALRPALGRRWISNLLTVSGRDWIPGLAGPYSGDATRSALALRTDKPAVRWEWIFIILLCLGSLAYWTAHYNYYYVPNADYGSFDEVAERIWQGRPLRNFKRLPTFPVLMGLVAKLISREPPTLHAGILLNMGFSAASLVLIFLIVRRCIGWLAIFPVILLAAHKHFAIWATQPIAEPCILFFVVLALFLFQRKSLWQYAPAFAASLTRYDAAPIIPVICLLNLIYDRPAGGFADWKALARRWLKHILLALVASAGILYWGAMILTNYQQKMPYQRFVAHGPIARMNGWVAVTTFAEPFNLPMKNRPRRLAGAAVVASVFLFGVYASFGLPLPKRLRGPAFRRVSMAVFLYFLAYLAMHLQFGMDRKRYAYPTLWIVNLYAVFGFACLCGLVAPAVSRLWNKHRGYLLGLLLALPVAGKALSEAMRMLHTRAANPSTVYLAFACLLVAVLVGYCMWRFRKPAWVLLPAALVITWWPGLPVMRSVRRYARGALTTKYKKHEYLLAARWLENNLREGECAVLTNTGMLKHYGTGLTDEQLVSLSDIKANNHRELISEMRDGGIRYLIFTPRSSLYDEEKQTGPRYAQWKIFLLQPFKWGGEPPGFRRVHTFNVPEAWAIHLAHVYELLPDDPRLAVPAVTCDETTGICPIINVLEGGFPARHPRRP